MYRSLNEQLKEWRHSPHRYPLLLRGARQVGKTYLIEQFGESEFDHYISINFEAQPEMIACFETLDPEQILIKLQAMLKVAVIPGKTLLFLDEIQMCPKAILSMRYFKEKLPQLHLIGAGSLLEFALSDRSFSFPVGRVQFLYLKPLSFVEYARARGQVLTLPNAIQPAHNHGALLQLFKEYCVIGGMPAAVSSFCQSLNLDQVQTVQEILLSTYEADFTKYATPNEQKYLKVLFHNIFPQITKHFKYSKIDADLRSRELKQALYHLESAGLIYPIYASSASGLPLTVQMKLTRFKALFLDVGLLQHGLKTNIQIILEKDLMQINAGAIAEQFVGQELLAYSDPNQSKQLLFWEREKQQSAAEVDYLYQFNEHIIPIEVKAGATGHLKSMQQFMKEKKCSVGVHIGLHDLSFKNNILKLPLYAISKLPDYLALMEKSEILDKA